MTYETYHSNRRILIKEADDGTFTAWQCMNTRKGNVPVVGWGGFPNATQALAAIKKKL